MLPAMAMPQSCSGLEARLELAEGSVVSEAAVVAVAFYALSGIAS